jgi:hypothetical protein
MKQLECSVGTGGERALAAVIFLGQEKIGWAGLGWERERQVGGWSGDKVVGSVCGVEIRLWPSHLFFYFQFPFYIVESK